MKIVQIVGGNEDGGLEKHFIELSNAINQKFEIYVIAHKKYKEYLNKNINFTELDLSKSRNNPIILFKLQKILKNINADIIHTHANKATHIISLLKPFINSKFIATLHSKKSNVKAYCRADFVIAVSEYILNDIKDSCAKLKLRESFRVIYNGVNLKNNTQKVDNITSNKNFKIASIGRLVDVKGFDILLKAFSEIDATLYILGEGKDEFKLKALAKELNIDRNVIFIGFVNNLEEYLNSMDLIVISSKREGFSYVFAETLLSKKPLISTDVADIKKIITKKFIVDIDDYEALNKKIKFVINNYDEVLKEFENSFKFAEENFSIDKMVDKTIEVYKKCLKN